MPLSAKDPETGVCLHCAVCNLMNTEFSRMGPLQRVGALIECIGDMLAWSVDPANPDAYDKAKAIDGVRGAVEKMLEEVGTGWKPGATPVMGVIPIRGLQ